MRKIAEVTRRWPTATSPRRSRRRFEHGAPVRTVGGDHDRKVIQFPPSNRDFARRRRHVRSTPPVQRHSGEEVRKRANRCLKAMDERQIGRSSCSEVAQSSRPESVIRSWRELQAKPVTGTAPRSTVPAGCIRQRHAERTSNFLTGLCSSEPDLLSGSRTRSRRAETSPAGRRHRHLSLR